MGRLIVATNRLPVHRVDGVLRTTEAGGIFPAVREAIAQHDGSAVWVGYAESLGGVDASGDATTAAAAVPPPPLTVEDGDEGVAYIAVPMAGGTQTEHYGGMCSGVIWPVLHHQEVAADAPVEVFAAYARVNELFAEVIAAVLREGDVVWVHDYQLLLLPLLLREKIAAQGRGGSGGGGGGGKVPPSLPPIGLFLHVPFPALEVLRRIPRCEDVLRGMLGADLVGFQAHAHYLHFTGASERLLGVRVRGTEVWVEDEDEECGGGGGGGGRTVVVEAFPTGVNLTRVQRTLQRPSLRVRVRELAEVFDGRRVIVGVDRMDYVKGLPQKLLAFERMLEDDASMVGRVVLVQISVPSRQEVGEYQRLRREVEELVGRINARFFSQANGQASVYYRYAYVPFEELAALHSVADVCLVTSLRDGMNVVSQEFVACQQAKESKGVLVLSEFAGAAKCLEAAIRVNPWNTSEVASALKRALQMSEQEKSQRHTSMWRYVLAHCAARWGRDFSARLACVEPSRAATDARTKAAAAAAAWRAAAAGGRRRVAAVSVEAAAGRGATESVRRLLRLLLLTPAPARASAAAAAPAATCVVVCGAGSREELSELCSGGGGDDGVGGGGGGERLWLLAECGCCIRRPCSGGGGVGGVTNGTGGGGGVWRPFVDPAPYLSSVAPARRILSRAGLCDAVLPGPDCVLRWRVDASGSGCSHSGSVGSAAHEVCELLRETLPAEGAEVTLTAGRRRQRWAGVDVVPKALRAAAVARAVEEAKEWCGGGGGGVFELFVGIPPPPVDVGVCRGGEGDGWSVLASAAEVAWFLKELGDESV